MVCCFYEMKNKGFVATGRKVDDENDEENEAEHRLMPRTQALPLYTMDEFNLKVYLRHALGIFLRDIREEKRP